MEKQNLDNVIVDLNDYYDNLIYSFSKLNRLFKDYDYKKEDIKISGKLFAFEKAKWTTLVQKHPMTVFQKTINLVIELCAKLESILQDFLVYISTRTHPIYSKQISSSLKMGYLKGVLDCLMVEKLNSIRFEIDIDSYTMLIRILKNLIEKNINDFDEMIFSFNHIDQHDKIQDI